MTMGTAGLQYLDFDFSEDEHGLGSFDAMASVLPAQVPALHAELTRVLAWACDAFSKGPLDEAYDWDYDLQAQDDDGEPLPAHFDKTTGQLNLQASATGFTTVNLSISGSAHFGDALREAFELE